MRSGEKEGKEGGYGEGGKKEGRKRGGIRKV